QVLLAGPHGSPEWGLGDQPGEDAEYGDGDHDDGKLHPGQGDGEVSPRDQGYAAGDDVFDWLHAGTLADLDEILQGDRHADGADQRSEAEGAAQRAVGDPLYRPAVEGGDGSGEDQGERQG